MAIRIAMIGAGSIGFTRRLMRDVGKIVGGIFVEVLGVAAGRALRRRRLAGLPQRRVFVGAEQKPAILLAAVAAVRRVERHDVAGTAEVRDHVELADDLRRALDVVDAAHARRDG